MKKITLPLTDDVIKELKAGDSVLLSGSIITGRDAAHKRLFELMEQGDENARTAIQAMVEHKIVDVLGCNGKA